MTVRYAAITDEVHSRPKHQRQALPLFQPADLDGRDVPARQWCVPEWFPDKAVSLLTGDGGTGKSLLAMQLATCAALGLPFLGMDLAARNVAYYSAEDDVDEMHRRQVDICASLRCNLSELRDRLYWLPMVGLDAVLVQADKVGRIAGTSTYEQLRRHCLDRHIKLLIVDTAADTFAGLEIDRQQVTRYVRILEKIAREMNGAVILLLHPSVAGLRDRTGISGSTAWRNAVRSVVHMARPENDDDDRNNSDNLRTLERLKGNYSATGCKLLLMYSCGAFLLDAPADVVRPQIDQLSVELKVLGAIKAALNSGKQPSSSNQSRDYVAKMLQPFDQCKGLSKAQIDRAVERMITKSELRVAHIGTGKNKRQVLVPSEWNALPDERDPVTGQPRKASS